MLFFSMITLVAIVFLRGVTFPELPLSLAAIALPGAVGLCIVSMGMTIMTQLLAIEREDGTLLRAKAVPGGMVGYFIGKILFVAVLTVVGIAFLLIPGVFIVHGVATGGVGSWLTILWVLVLGLAAILPIGVVCGSLFPNPRIGGLINIPYLALAAISGIFYPLARFPQWLQDIAQVFPVYWLGLGMRSALLPGDMVVGEVGGSWRHLTTLLVLAVWAVGGLTVAPMVLRRMARRESGSTLAHRRERASQRVW